MPIPKHLQIDLADKEYAHAYVDEFLNVSIATQLKVLREQQDLTQEKLANLAGMKQERISVLENVNYSSWSINTLRKLAHALDVTLKVSFESFGSRLADMRNVTRQSLERLSREQELASDTAKAPTARKADNIAGIVMHPSSPTYDAVEEQSNNYVALKPADNLTLAPIGRVGARNTSHLQYS
jgi:transcriptional regulator with XRE-family HTH domain